MSTADAVAAQEISWAKREGDVHADYLPKISPRYPKWSMDELIESANDFFENSPASHWTRQWLIYVQWVVVVSVELICTLRFMDAYRGWIRLAGLSGLFSFSVTAFLFVRYRSSPHLPTLCRGVGDYRVRCFNPYNGSFGYRRRATWSLGSHLHCEELGDACVGWLYDRGHGAKYLILILALAFSGLGNFALGAVATFSKATATGVLEALLTLVLLLFALAISGSKVITRCTCVTCLYWRAFHYEWAADPEREFRDRTDRAWRVAGSDSAGADEIPPIENPPLGQDLDRRNRSRRIRAYRILAASVRGGVPPRVMVEKRSGECVYCGGNAATADHIRALSRGGWHDPDNLAPSCFSCNSQKGTLLLTEWDLQDKVNRACHRNYLVASEMLRCLWGSYAHEQGYVEKMSPLDMTESNLMKIETLLGDFSYEADPSSVLVTV